MNSRIAAHCAVAKALYAGKLVRADACSRCGGTSRKIHAHHEDYSCPLDVMWLCVTCHHDRHRELKTYRGRPRCLGCGYVVYLHTIENGQITRFATGIAHKGACARRAGYKIWRAA